MAARGCRWQQGIDYKQDMWEHFGVMQMFYMLTVVVFTKLYAGFFQNSENCIPNKEEIY